MAASAGKWLTVTGDTDGNGVKHQCKLSYDGGHEAVATPAFEWPVMGDFTIVTSTHNSTTGAAEVAANGNTVTLIQGSVTGVDAEYIDLTSSGTMQANGEYAGAFIYDFDAKGLMPHMRLSVNPSTNDTVLVYVTVIPHHMV
jgi:hypothetical protein